MSKIDEVIKAIKEADMTAYLARNPAVPFPLVRLAQEALADSYTAMARAAIEAMREPTDAMVDVMNDVVIDGPDYVDFHPSMADCASLWTAGIDAALNEQVSG